MTSDGPQRRELRDFDYEAELRQRRLFVLLMVGFAILAILAGIIVAIWVIPPPENPTPPPMPPDEPPPVVQIDPPTRLPDDLVEPSETKRPGLPETLGKGDIDKGIRRMQSKLDRCAQEHGAIDETYVTVDFSVAAGGRVEMAFSRAPHTSTPLGRCVAEVFRTHGKFKRTRTGLADIRRTVRLRRPDLMAKPVSSQVQ